MHPAQIVVALALVLTPSLRASAQDVDLVRAREAFENAELAFEANDYSAALDGFRDAYDLAPNDRVRFNIAVCLERLGRFREAAFEYNAATRSEELPAEDRASASEMARRAEERLGTLMVISTLADTQVRIDGTLSCTAPCSMTLDPGEHEVVLSAPGQPAMVRSAFVERGQIAAVEFSSEVPPPVLHAPESPSLEEAATPRSRSRALMWTGASIALAGVGGTIGFGLHTQALGENYRANPTVGLRDDGHAFRAATNVSIGVACVGALLVAVDLIFLGK